MSILAFFGTPIGRWIVIVALIAMALFAGGAYERNVGYQERADEDAKKDQAAERAYLGMIAEAQKLFAALTGKYDALKAESDKRLKAAEAKRLHDLAEQERRLKNDLPAAAVAVCPFLPFGYSVHRYNAAQIANGGDTRAAQPATDAAAAAPGLPLTDVARLDDAQAGAYKACSERVTEWEKYAQGIVAWREDVNAAIRKALQPQGE